MADSEPLDQPCTESTSVVAGDETEPAKRRLIVGRLAIGLVVLICAEVFSGASLGMGLWHPWTLVVTYWLYFAHFFFFTTLAVATGRTTLPSLYLWGVLFGLYESWITKVIWYGYSGDGKFVLGSIGPFGFSEISMVFLFHPVMSFILPLSVACLLCPSLRRTFPDLAWITGTGKWATFVRVYLVICFAPVIAMNSGGPINLAVNVVVAIVCLALLKRLARPAFESPDGRDLVVFGRSGFAGLCLYLALLYGVTYVGLRPEGLPSTSVQLLTFVVYTLAIIGLRLHGPAEQSLETIEVDQREWQLVKGSFAALVTLALLLSTLRESPALYLPIMVNFMIWTPLGFLLTVVAIGMGLRRSSANERASATTD